MAQQLQNINLIAPGFRGLNTEESPLGQDQSFAAVADNCVIDRFGRIAARKGNNVVTTTKTELGSATIEVIHSFEDSAGNEVLFSAGNNKILSGTTTLVDETPATYTITSDEWDIVNFNDNCYFFQRGYEPLVYNNSLAAVTKMSDVVGYGVAPSRSLMDGNTVLSAFGRLWVADFADDKHTIYWSDLLQGHVWNGGSSGSIDISKVWPDGYDEIVKLAEHNGFLIIFGRHSIVVYANASSPASMQVSDTISGIGARCRCAVETIGTDILFVSYDGLRSLGRVIQEKSLPIGDLSRNVRTDMIEFLSNETIPLRVVYSPENSFFLVGFKGVDIVYCFDVRGKLENGSYRATRWPDTGWRSFHRKDDGTLYIGDGNGIGTYSGYNDNDDSYLMRYYSQNLTFGDSSRLKILKKIKPTIIGGSGSTVIFKWGYDFSGSYKSATTSLASGDVSEYGVAEFAVGEFSDGILVETKNINTTGDGASIVVGMEATISGNALSLQEMNVLTLIGKLV